MRKQSLVGQKFGRLYVVADGVTTGDHTSTSLCRCDCGRPDLVTIRNKQLKNGSTVSCGCLKRERCSEMGKRTGKIYAPRAQARAKEVNGTHRMSKSRLYHLWQQMHQRCENPKNNHYDYYGERGISVTPEWHSFEPFYEWAMSAGYSDSLTIDRIDPNKDYCPENCRWITRTENSSRVRQGKHRYWCLSEKDGFYAEFDVITTFLRAHPWLHTKRE